MHSMSSNCPGSQLFLQVCIYRIFLDLVSRNLIFDHPNFCYGLDILYPSRTHRVLPERPLFRAEAGV
jgi:hypothetical protein